MLTLCRTIALRCSSYQILAIVGVKIGWLSGVLNSEVFKVKSTFDIELLTRINQTRKKIEYLTKVAKRSKILRYFFQMS